MAAIQNFRGAVGGFNREDVVHYIEYMNNKHSSQINQLNTEMQALQEELAQLRGKTDLSAQLEEANARIAQLEQERDALAAQVEQMSDRPQTDNELEAYRRAERAERIAGESHYPLKKMLALAFDGITSLSVKPIRLIALFGTVVSALSFVGMWVRRIAE